MKYIDVTLRDGGHQHGFNWPFDFIKRYLKTLNLFQEIDYIEIGYWKQSEKYSGPFYSIDENLLASICKLTNKKLSIMVDFHYCSHNVRNYPINSDFPKLGLIRVCLRKEDIKEGCKFIKKLKKFTNCKLSINFFNVTNYSENELQLACEEATDSNADFIYFADTHGALDLGNNLKIFKKLTSLIKKTGMVPGLHLHDHSGKAYYNYRNLSDAGFDVTDVSLGGLGKGLGNLKLEHVFDLRGREKILDHLINDQELFSMPSGPYGILTARDSITDHYAVEGEKREMMPSHFSKRLNNIVGLSKDNYNTKILGDE